MKRVRDPDDPRRCEGQSTLGEQCWNESEEDSNKCFVCASKAPDERDDFRDFLTENYKRRIRIECPDGEEVKLLRDNVMDLNAMLAYYRNQVKDKATLDSNAAAIIDLVKVIEKTTGTLHRLSVTSGLLLARPALIRWGQSIVNAVSDVIQDKYDGWEDDLIDLSDRIAKIIAETRNEEGEKP